MRHNTENSDEFDSLCHKVQGCNKCNRMAHSQRVLNRSGGALDADIMFIGEAPGRLGADNSGIPFHGDKSGHNFEALLDFAKIDRSRIFVTNAALCNPKDEDGNNSTPTKLEVKNCAEHLTQQLLIINPKIIVTLGSTALESTRFIHSHNLILKSNVRTAHDWLGRMLIPLYHPGQRAMLHRSFANQRSDYQFVAEHLRRIERPKKNQTYSATKGDIIPIVKELLTQAGQLDYFMLHKLYYLVEFNYFMEYKHRLSSAYIVRQKDGPYCTDLHIQKLKKCIPELSIKQRNGQLILDYSQNLFERNDLEDDSAGAIIQKVVANYGKLTNAQIKTKVYLTAPMRHFLRIERRQNVNLYNAPIQFEHGNIN